MVKVGSICAGLVSAFLILLSINSQSLRLLFQLPGCDCKTVFLECVSHSLLMKSLLQVLLSLILKSIDLLSLLSYPFSFSFSFSYSLVFSLIISNLLILLNGFLQLLDVVILLSNQLLTLWTKTFIETIEERLERYHLF